MISAFSAKPDLNRQYGWKEKAFATPVVHALVTDQEFREWVVGRSKFSDKAHDVALLADEMKEQRSKAASNWWASHWSGSCNCQGCSHQETDLLAIFQAVDGFRFALHVEIKNPSDRFIPGKNQAANYPVRAACWATNPPKSVLPHADADTVLLCSAEKLPSYGDNVFHFGFVLTFEEISRSYPSINFPELA